LVVTVCWFRQWLYLHNLACKTVKLFAYIIFSVLTRMTHCLSILPNIRLDYRLMSIAVSMDRARIIRKEGHPGNRTDKTLMNRGRLKYLSKVSDEWREGANVENYGECSEVWGRSPALVGLLFRISGGPINEVLSREPLVHPVIRAVVKFSVTGRTPYLHLHNFMYIQH